MYVPIRDAVIALVEGSDRDDWFAQLSVGRVARSPTFSGQETAENRASQRQRYLS